MIGNIGNIIGSAAGLVPSLASGIYELRKNRGERDALKQIQASGGAGARAIEESTAAGVRTAQGVSSGAGGQSAGLGLLTGLRAGEQARAQGTGQAATMAAAESARATQQLDQNELARRKGISKLAGAMGSIIPTLSAGVLAGKDKAPVVNPSDHTQVSPALAALGVQPVPDVTLQPSLGSDNLTANIDPMDHQEMAPPPQELPAEVETKSPPVADKGEPKSDGELAKKTAIRDAYEAQTKDLKARLYKAFNSPEMDLMIAGGHTKDSALNVAFPELAAERSAYLQGQGT